MACGTACHTVHEASFCASSIAQKIYSMARASSLKLPGFPKFESVVQELNNMREIAPPQYEVTVALGNGGLAIKENLLEYWLKEEHLFATEMAHALKEHNKKYNPKGIKRGAPEVANGEAQQDQAAKKIKVEASIKGLDHEATMEDKFLGS